MIWLPYNIVLLIGAQPSVQPHLEPREGLCGERHDSEGIDFRRTAKDEKEKYAGEKQCSQAHVCWCD